MSDDDIDISILDTSDEEIEEEPDLIRLLEEHQELLDRARALGVKNVDELTEDQINERITVLLRVRAEGLTRLEFDENKELVPSLENLRILQIEAVEKKHTLTRQDVLEKLKGYRLLTDKFDTNNKRWTRYIDTTDGFLRAGGFPIRNKRDEEFIVLKNVSKKFTFSIKRDNVILMEKLPTGHPLLVNDELAGLVSEFHDVRESGILFVALKDTFLVGDVHFSTSNTELARDIGVNRGTLGRKFRAEDIKHKNFWLFKLSRADVDDLIRRVSELTDEDREDPPIPDDLMAVINLYY